MIELDREIKELLLRLELSTKNFDDGYYQVAKDMSNQISLMCHSTANHNSLLKSYQLEKKVKFVSTRSFVVVGNVKIFLCDLLGYHDNRVLFQARSSEFKNNITCQEIEYSSPYHNKSSQIETEELDFDSWWKEAILQTADKSYNRKELVRFVRNKDCGVHKEKNIKDKEYKKYRDLQKIVDNLSVFNVSKKAVNNYGETINVRYSAVYSVIRSIASEIINSFSSCNQ